MVVFTPMSIDTRTTIYPTRAHTVTPTYTRHVDAQEADHGENLLVSIS